MDQGLGQPTWLTGVKGPGQKGRKEVEWWGSQSEPETQMLRPQEGETKGPGQEGHQGGS